MGTRPLDAGAQQGAADAAAAVVGMHRELLEVGADPVLALTDRIDAAEADRRIPGNEHDERGGELGDGARPWQRPDAERLEHRVCGLLEWRQLGQLVGPHRPNGGDGVHRPTVACRPVRAVVCNELGPPSLLRIEERPDPVPGPGHVVVDVEAAGVNYVDALFVGGQYQIKPPRALRARDRVRRTRVDWSASR